MKKFKEVSTSQKFSDMEKEIIAKWRSEKTFERTLENRKDAKQCTFFDGPPFATGLPHYGHIVGSVMKDVVPRYWTMRGYRVDRKWGWDCHGLPIENIVEKELGSKKKKDIEAMGVDIFNQKCRETVLMYVEEWKKTIERVGRWADMENAYLTMDTDYMESIWWVFKQLWDKGLVYKDYRSMHICPRCETTLSQQEVSEGYKDIKDLSVIAKFELVDEPGTYVLAWTTTPWTLPGNVALAVGENIDYVVVEKEESEDKLVRFIVAKDLAQKVFGDNVADMIIDECTGSFLVGKKYKPLFDAYVQSEKLEERFETEGEQHVVVAAVVNRSGKMLLGLREYTKDHPQVEKDFWIAPGGKIEGSETMREALARELREECGLSDYVIKKYIGASAGYLTGHKLHFVLVEVSDDVKIINAEPEKFAKWEFYDRENMVADMFPNAENDLQMFDKALEWYRAYTIYAGDFVTTEDGTGVVHIAPAFGTDDMHLGREKKLPFVQHVAMDGSFKEELGDLAGLNVKPIDDHQSTDIEIIKRLAQKGLLFHKEKYEHSYPHCWRCDTPLINYATSSWFVSVTKVKDRALEHAKNINWSPAHMKEGRFGNWLSGAQDWSISRQRFWASVIPIWECEKCGDHTVVGSVAEISEQFGNPNTLYLVRHGESENNVKDILNSDMAKNVYHLTEKGIEQVRELVQEIKDVRIDAIYASPLLRAQETAQIISEATGVQVITDERLREFGFGKLSEKTEKEFHEILRVWPEENVELREKYDVESEKSARDRLVSFVDDINATHQNKNIVVVTHGDPLQVLRSYLRQEERIKTYHDIHPQNGKAYKMYSKNVDLHKHVMDHIAMRCEKCDGVKKRVPDVLDTWFDSGSMPYAQKHYPFENCENFEKNFPADFIAEGVDQTRAWFYYLHVLATSIKDQEAFRNVIVNGIVLAEDGKKMAKKLKNYPDPGEMFEKYGADSIRFYLMQSPVVAAENLNFKEGDVSEITRGMMRMLWNSYAFFVLYASVDGYEKKKDFDPKKLKNKLDRWVISELHVLIRDFNNRMEAYELHKAARLFLPFVDHLSNWYIRRSRKRFWKSENDVDKDDAYATLHYVLVELSKVMAPFTPFIAEEIYTNLTGEESVHLANMPMCDNALINEAFNINMALVREIITEGLSKRAAAKIKVRQPLASISLGGKYKDLTDAIFNVHDKEFYEQIIMDELNVKHVSLNLLQAQLQSHEPIMLDTMITPELEMEGQAREIIRHIQQLRKKAVYKIDDRISVGIDGMSDVVKAHYDLIAHEVLASRIEDENLVDYDIMETCTIDGLEIVVTLKK